MKSLRDGNDRLDAVIARYLHSRRSGDWPVSVASAVQAVRAECQPGLSDQQLGKMIAEYAVGSGRNVAFDLDGKSNVDAGASSAP